jgi:type I restriction enzyme S subunit
MAMNQSCYGIQAQHEHGDYFIYFNISSQIGNLLKAGHGSVFNTITSETFNYIKSAIPPNTLTKAFDEAIRSLMLRIVYNLKESHFLFKIRDILLPKLISGEIRAPEAGEKQLAAKNAKTHEDIIKS